MPLSFVTRILLMGSFVYAGCSSNQLPSNTNDGLSPETVITRLKQAIIARDCVTVTQLIHYDSVSHAFSQMQCEQLFSDSDTILKELDNIPLTADKYYKIAKDNRYGCARENAGRIEVLYWDDDDKQHDCPPSFNTKQTQ